MTAKTTYTPVDDNTSNTSSANLVLSSTSGSSNANVNTAVGAIANTVLKNTGAAISAFSSIIADSTKSESYKSDTNK